MNWQETASILQENLTQPPGNEQDTRFRVIDPILLELGYTRYEINSNNWDGNGGIPDYTILPGDNAGWYLEAKAWNVPLEEKHARQATTYAYQNGKRWVVLTNGREWRLYDSHIPGQSADRVTLSWTLCPEMIPDASPILFQAICKETVCEGCTERFVYQNRLHAVLIKEMAHPTSELINVIWKSLRKRVELCGISKEMVVNAYCDNNKFDTPAISPIPSTDGIPLLPERVTNAIPLPSLLDPTICQITGNKPAVLIYPDGTSLNLKTWADLSVSLLDWLGKEVSLPSLPFSDRKGKSYFLNTEPVHQNSSMKNSRQFQYFQATIYMDSNRSSINLVESITSVCSAINYPPDNFRVVLRDKAEL